MRWLLAGSAMVLGVALVLWGGITDPKDQHDAARDLGLAFVEVAVAVAIIDRLIERSEKNAEVKRLAWNALEELDHAVWVWLGGHRKLDFGELRQLLGSIKSEPIPYFTQNLLLRLGSKAAHTLVLREDVTKLSADLKRGLASLEPLASLRDGSSLPPSMIGAALREAANHLSKVLEISEAGALPTITSEAAIEFQFWRHFGQWPNKYDLERIEEAAHRAPRPGREEPAEPMSA
jgi:hypothetical protein